jgi:hypothetical protein
MLCPFRLATKRNEEGVVLATASQPPQPSATREKRHTAAKQRQNPAPVLDRLVGRHAGRHWRHLSNGVTVAPWRPASMGRWGGWGCASFDGRRRKSSSAVFRRLFR